MLEQLLRRFIKDADRVQDPKVRERYGTFAGGVGRNCPEWIWADRETSLKVRCLTSG